MKLILICIIISCSVGTIIYFALLMVLFKKRLKFPFAHSGTLGKFIIIGSLLFCLIFQLIMNLPAIKNSQVREFMVMLNGGLFHYVIYFEIITR